MKYQARELRRLWSVSLYDGDPDDPDTPILEETVIAWNAVDAGRRTQGKRLAKPPVPLFFVSWDEPPLIIDDTGGPIDEEAHPSIAYVDLSEDWSD
jgi:hypothetical protein